MRGGPCRNREDNREDQRGHKGYRGLPRRFAHDHTRSACIENGLDGLPHGGLGPDGGLSLPDLLFNFLGGFAGLLGRLLDGGLHRRDCLVCSFLGDFHSRFGRRADRLRHVPCRLDGRIRDRLERPRDVLHRGPNRLDGLVDHGLQVLCGSIQRRGTGFDGPVDRFLSGSQESIDFAPRGTAGGTDGGSHRELGATVWAIHPITKVPTRPSLICVSVAHRRVWGVTANSAAAWTIPGAYDFTIRVRIETTFIHRVRAASASRRVRASGYCSLGQSSWYTIVPRPRKASKATSRYSRASKWPMRTQSATPRGATSRQSPNRGITFVARFNRIFVVK